MYIVESSKPHPLVAMTAIMAVGVGRSLHLLGCGQMCAVKNLVTKTVKFQLKYHFPGAMIVAPMDILGATLKLAHAVKRCAYSRVY